MLLSWLLLYLPFPSSLPQGTPTSYCDVFPRALEFFLSKIGSAINSDIWEKYGPYSCLLNVDEVEDMGKTWAWIADKIGQPVAEVRAAIEPIRDVYVLFYVCMYVCM